MKNEHWYEFNRRLEWSKASCDFSWLAVSFLSIFYIWRSINWLKWLVTVWKYVFELAFVFNISSRDELKVGLTLIHITEPAESSKARSIFHGVVSKPDGKWNYRQESIKIYSFVSRFGHEKAACTGSRALVSCALTKLSRHWHLSRRSRAHISCEKIAKYHKFVWNYEKSALHYGDFFTWRLGNYSPRESKTSENSKWLDFLICREFTYEIHCDRQFSA